jgi:hypothetical protein
MGTWYTITVKNPGKHTEQKLADGLADHLFDLDVTDWRDEWGTPDMPGYHPADPSGNLVAQGGSKYTADAVRHVARKLSRKPGRTVTVHEEWDTRDADEPGEELDVYRDGERVPAECKYNALVPVTLADLISDVRRSMPLASRGAPIPFVTYVTDLVDALDPDGAKA